MIVIDTDSTEYQEILKMKQLIREMSDEIDRLDAYVHEMEKQLDMSALDMSREEFDSFK